MDGNVGVYSYTTALALLSVIAIQLAMVIYRLRRIHEVLTTIRGQTDLISWWATLKGQPPGFHSNDPRLTSSPSPDPRHSPGSPFSRTDR